MRDTSYCLSSRPSLDWVPAGTQQTILKSVSLPPPSPPHYDEGTQSRHFQSLPAPSSVSRYQLYEVNLPLIGIRKNELHFFWSLFRWFLKMTLYVSPSGLSIQDYYIQPPRTVRKKCSYGIFMFMSNAVWRREGLYRGKEAGSENELRVCYDF